MNRAGSVSAVLALAAFTACQQAQPFPSQEPPEAALAVSPAIVEVEPSASLAFDATVGGIRETSVTWSIEEATGGTITAEGLYTAPAVEGDFHVVASRVTATGDVASAQVKVRRGAVNVTVTPGAVSLETGASQAFTASVTGPDDRVTWSVQEGDAGGNITSAGVYAAPATSGTYHVVATSVVRTTSFAIATATVTAPTPPPPPPPPPPPGGGMDPSWVDVTAHGAKGDGITDDTAAFRAAAATARVLWIPRPSNHYRLSGTVNLRNGVQGDGSMPRVRMYGSAGDLAHRMFYMNQIAGTATQPIKVNGVWLDGGWTGQSVSEHAHLLHIKGSQYVEVSGSVFVGAAGDGVFVGDDESPYTVARYINIHDNKFWKNYRCGPGVVSGANGSITNNEITKTNSFVNAIGFEPYNSAQYVRDWTVSGNWFNSPYRGAVYGRYGWKDPSAPWCGNVTLTNNHGTWPSDSGNLAFWHLVVDSLPWVNVALSNDTRDMTAPPAP